MPSGRAPALPMATPDWSAIRGEVTFQSRTTTKTLGLDPSHLGGEGHGRSAGTGHRAQHTAPAPRAVPAASSF